MEILKLNQKNLREIVETTAQSIKQGKIVVCPTDTIYGLLADATNKKAVEKTFKIKNRPKTKPLPIFVTDLKRAKEIAKVGKKQEKFLKKSWPGKVTVVLERTRLRPSGYSGQRKIKLYGVDKKTIALRIPKYKLVNDLLKKTNCPLTGTSANLTDKPGSAKIKEVLKQFKNQKVKPNLIIDAGNLKSSKPSKVIDLTGKKPKILRK